ncbi:aspartyl-phosphate phosphatase Spo0E family protein [Desulfofundulus thermosubterraneus]|uniref:Spo0E like sporulation regulatory protein n=1 Tax=Desulfofundulus thermosubterraneus DSM 16057 TaxID=1121432 RepID=A0A1M6L8K6_9FIRM|nr:aspartyl-phosphate phosphatase Spo0E family protein [Desulfofundulus thermosubterraneus]SHJ67409.1 hypothetical protein SAMN02745219_03082 [Desulfofundulus thermosubterraneus DSM 16057]
MLDLGRAILRLEKVKGELLNTDPRDKEKLLAASRKVDELVMEYYRVKHSPETTGSAARR